MMRYFPTHTITITTGTISEYERESEGVRTVLFSFRTSSSDYYCYYYYYYYSYTTEFFFLSSDGKPTRDPFIFLLPSSPPTPLPHTHPHTHTPSFLLFLQSTFHSIYTTSTLVRSSLDSCPSSLLPSTPT